MSATSLIRCQSDRFGTSPDLRSNRMPLRLHVQPNHRIPSPPPQNPLGAQHQDRQRVRPTQRRAAAAPCRPTPRRAPRRSATRGARGSHSRDAFTASSAVPPRVVRLVDPRRAAAASRQRCAAGAKRSVSESTRVAPRCRTRDRARLNRPPTHDASAPDRPRAAGARPAPRRDDRTLGGQPVEDAAPERRERIGRDAAAEAPAPQARRGNDRDATRLVRAHEIGLRSSPRPRRASSASHVPFGLRRRDGDRRQAVPDESRERRRERRRRRRRRIPLAFGRRT